MSPMREFAASSNGDRWYFAVDEVTGERFVVHRGNQPSGGHETKTAVDTFLKMRPRGPEHDALLTLVSELAGAPELKGTGPA